MKAQACLKLLIKKVSESGKNWEGSEGSGELIAGGGVTTTRDEN